MATSYLTLTVEEPHDYSVHLIDPGFNKLNVILVVRRVTDLGLAEAKALVESAPALVRSGLYKGEAERICRDFRYAGAIVELRKG